MSHEPDSSNPLHSFDFALKTKPRQAIKILHEKLYSFGVPFELEQGEEVYFSDDKETAFIILLTEGCISVCHFNTGLHAGTGFAPTVLGLIDGYSLYYGVENRPRHYICA
ncbi:cytoplasmic protein, partial [Salmonella enterica]|nr:cytoplasmic protein [Salmonella enterica]